MNRKRIFGAAITILLAVTLIFGTQVNAASAGEVPIGTITAYAGDTSGSATGALERQGWLVCNGEEYPIDNYSELNNIIGTYYGTASRAGYFKTPDLRGRFLRGVDYGQGRDPDAGDRTASATGGNTGDKVGSYQEDQFKSHSHSYTVFPSGRGDIADGRYWQQGSGTTGSTGGSETRPKNIYVNWIIKAKNVD